MTRTGEVSRQRIKEVLQAQKWPTVTILSSLLAIHDEFGYLPAGSVDVVAGFVGSTANEVWGVATFYTNFRFSPPPDHLVEVCWGPTCHLAGATSIIESLLKALGLHEEGETEGNGVGIRYNTCLGACSQAPVISVDHRLQGQVKADTVSSYIEPIISRESE